MLQDLVDKINTELSGYHVDISLYPAGGMIDAMGCEECGTRDGRIESASWRKTKRKNKTIDEAINELKIKLEVE